MYILFRYILFFWGPQWVDGNTYAVAGSGAHQLPHVAAAQGIAFALRGEEPQLLALLIRQ